VPLPVFGPAGSIPRVDAAEHYKLTVTMKEIDQAVLPQGMQDTCGLGVTLGKTRVWAYEISDTKNGKILGPAHWPAVTIEARRGIPTNVTYVNQLPSFNSANPTGPGLVQGLLTIDQTLHWANPLNTLGCGMPLDCTLPANANNPCCQPFIGPQPATVHLHGGEDPSIFDGGPDSWFTPNGITGPGYGTFETPGPGKAIYTYDNKQEPGTLWFHDHALGITRTNVLAGLAGFYFLEDPSREPQQLPSGPYEIELAIQDRLFDTQSQLLFPDGGSNPTQHPFWIADFLGDVSTVNGAAWPYLEVEPRRYRFRLLDGSNTRLYNLSFGSAPVYQIGADDNYIDVPVPVNSVFISPGERADVIVDFSGLAGHTIKVTNSDMSFPPPDPTLADILEIRVVLPLSGEDKSCDPARPDPTNGVCARKIPVVRLTDGQGNIVPGVVIDKKRQFVLKQNPQTEQFVNNTNWDGLISPSIGADFPTDGISELPQVGSVEEWEIINISPDPHPMHTHLAQFQVLNRQNLETAPTPTNFTYAGVWYAAFGTGPVPLPSDCTAGEFCPGYGPPLPYNIPNGDGAVGGNPAVSPYLSGNPIPPTSGETGWKDTVKAFAGQVTRVLVRWTPTDKPVTPNMSYAGTNFYPFDPTSGPGYVWHCHMIGHEDNEMMRPYKVVP
jgi:FtsP/CotA-like multicopper oxidase with cupredoxin domain